MILLYNFEPVEEEQFRLSYLNRAFQYNDGLFDTLIFTDGRIRFLHDHLDRLRRALRLLGLTIPEAWLEERFWQQQVALLIEANALSGPAIRIKVKIWRRPGGLFTPESTQADILLTGQTQATLPALISQAAVIRSVPVPYSPFSFFKGPNAFYYVQAGLAKKQAGVDEAILLDARGYISECLVSNIFWFKDLVLYTPALETGCIAGIMRLNVLRACQMLRYEVREGFYSEQELLAADLVFTSNVTGLRAVQAIGNVSFASTSTMFKQLVHMVLSPFH